MNRPIAAWLAAFAIGIALLQACPRLPPVPGWLFTAAVIVASAALFVEHRWRSRTRADSDAALRATLAAVFAVLACGLLGFSYAAWRAHLRLADELPPAWEGRDVRITGIVDDLPQNGPRGARFALAVERIDTAGAVVPRRVSLAWFPAHNGEPSHASRTQPADTWPTDEASRRDTAGDSALPVVHAGECWSVTVRLKRPHGNVNPGGFDLEAWLLERNLRATGYVRDSPANMRVCPFAGRPGDHVQRARERIRARIAKALPDAPYAGVLTALAIGDQRAISEAQWSVFNRTGVTHLVSISGLHVTIFAMLAGGCALLCIRRSTTLTSRIPARKLAVVVGVLFAFGYVLLAGGEVPALRTLLMLVVAAAGLWLGRPGTALLVWLWSLAAVLLWDPWASLTPGFWLSFGAVGLLLYTGSGRLAGPVRCGVRTRLVRVIREAVHAQWVVTIGLVPGTLALFHQVSVVSALANAVAIPAITLGVVPLALLAIAVPIDGLWVIAHAVLAVPMRCLEWIAALPSAAWSTHAPRGWTIAVAIAGVAWMLAPRGTPGRLFGTAWLLPFALLLPPAVPPGGVRVTVLDVGQGLAVVVATARHTLVYDTGPKFNDTVDAGARLVLPFLGATGVAHLDAVVVSHADNDHSGGARSIMQAIPVARLISSLPGNHPIVAQAGRKTESTHCESGMRWEWDGVTFTILHPRPVHYDEPTRKTNDLSCVLRIEAASASVLLTGDIEAPAETDLLRSPHVLASDVVVVPHHGSRTSSTAEFVDAVSPSVAVVAAGYLNRFGHPRDEVLARYLRAGATRLRTDRQGAITVTIAPGVAPITIAERDRRRRYWYDDSR